MKIHLKEVEIPEFLVSIEPFILPTSIYEKRCQEAYDRGGCDWLVVYGDREHFANLTYLTHFDPRFEEAVLLLGPGHQRVLLVGNEGMGYVSQAGLPLRFELCQSLSLMGQKRDKAPSLFNSLLAGGIGHGDTIGLAGWKYLEPEEQIGDFPTFFAPSVLVDSLRLIAGNPGGVIEATPILMHPESGLRARNEAEQIAAFEWGAARATTSVRRIAANARPGMTEYEAVAQMGYEGDALNAHVMFASGKETIVGLRSPTSRRIEQGDGVTTAVSLWGGLCARAGLVDDGNDEFLTRAAIPYYRGIVTWYETLRIGVSGGILHDRVCEAMASGGLRPMLNPGHLTGHDEWIHTPVRPGSQEQIASGMAFQCDIIPEPLPPGWMVNCEDPLVIADQGLREEIKLKFPEVWERIQARQAFMRSCLGIQIAEEVLPLSSTPACLAPLWLAPGKILAVV